MQVLADAKALAKENPAATADELKQLFLNRHQPRPEAPSPNGPDFVAFLYQSLETVDRQQFSISTYENRRAVINKFAQWRAAVPMADLTPTLIEEFDTYGAAQQRYHAQKESGYSRYLFPPGHQTETAPTERQPIGRVRHAQEPAEARLAKPRGIGRL